MDEQNKNKDIGGQLGNIDRAKRNLIERKKEVDQQIAKLTSEVAGLEDRAPLSMLQEAIKKEVEQQQRIRAEIEKFSQDIRKLRQEKTRLYQERNETIENIRSRQLEVALHKQTLRDSSSSESQREYAKSSISALEESEIPAYRSMHAEQSAEISKINTRIQGRLGEREFAESQLSASRKDVQDFKPAVRSREEARSQIEKLSKRGSAIEEGVAEYEERRKRRQLSEAERMTASGLRRDLLSGEDLDPSREGRRAGAAIGGKGAGFLDRGQYSKATEEFTALFNAIKETKVAMASLQEGTEEYAKKQEELSSLTDKAADRAKKLKEIEDRVEDRSRGGGFGSTLARTMGGAFSMGSQAFTSLGDRASERYVLEEEAKNARIRLGTSSFRDFRSRGTSAESFLMSGGGRIFGGESPYTSTGGISETIQRLGKDVANARQAMPQYAEAFRIMSEVPQIAVNTASGAARGAAASASTPWGAVGGGILGGGAEALQGFGNLGLSSLRNAMLTPEIAHGMGGERATAWARGGIDKVTEGTNKALGKLGEIAEKGGTNLKMFNDGTAMATGAMGDVAKALPNVLQRAYETVDIVNKLTSSQQQSAQIERIRERYQAAIAPMLQGYMDVQPSVKRSMRNRFMSRGERETEDINLEGLMQDRDLADRGFSPGDIMNMQGEVTGRMGWSGRGARGRGVTKTALELESMGLGSAQQSVQAMTAMSRAGIEDPSTVMERAVHNAFLSGIRDSREFQGLLEAASETSENTTAFEGTLNQLLSVMGTGRPGEVRAAREQMMTREREFSGASGTMADMVKFNIINQKAKELRDFARKTGDDLSEQDMQDLRMTQYMSPREMGDQKFLESRFSSRIMNTAKRFNAANPGKNFFTDLSNQISVRSATFGASTMMQDPEWTRKRNIIESGDQEKIKKEFPTPESAQDFLRRGLLYSGRESGNDSMAVQDMQLLSNKLNSAGIKAKVPGTLGSQAINISYADARKEGLASRTMSDQQDRATAIQRQEEKAFVDTMLRDQQTKQSKGAIELGTRTREKTQEQISGAIQKATVEPTVQVPKGMEVKPIEDSIKQLMEGLDKVSKSFENFSVSKMAMNVAGDVIVKGPGKIVGAIVDQGISAVTKDVGEKIVSSIKGAFGGSSSPSRAVESGNKPPPLPGAPVGGG